MRIIPSGKLLAVLAGSLLLGHMPAMAKNPVSFSIGDVRITEGDGAVNGSSFAVFTVKASGPLLLGATYTATVTTATGTATAGSDCVGETDFVTVSRTLSFTAGQTEQRFSVLVCPDYRAESDETFTVNLTYGSAPFNTSASARCTIIDEDKPALRIGDVTTNELDTNAWVRFPVTLSYAISQDIVCDVIAWSRTGVDTATRLTDYQAFGGTLTIRAGQTSGSFAVTVYGDNMREPDETFRVSIPRATNAYIQDGEAVCTIRNDD